MRIGALNFIRKDGRHLQSSLAHIEGYSGYSPLLSTEHFALVKDNSLCVIGFYARVS